MNRVDKLLKDAGAVLLRQKTHKVYRLPNGKTFVTSKTPSDINAVHAQYADLRKLLGIPRHPAKLKPVDYKKVKVGRHKTYRQKKGMPYYREPVLPNIHPDNRAGNNEWNSSLRDELSRAGVSEQALETNLEFEMGQNALLGGELKEVIAENEKLSRSQCWFCVTKVVVKELWRMLWGTAKQ